MTKNVLSRNLAATILLFSLPVGLATQVPIQSKAGSNDYPSSGAYCSAGASCDLRDAPPDSLVDKWGFYNRECTSFAAWRMERDGHPMSNDMKGPNGNSGHFGDAYNWAANAQAIGFQVSASPANGTVAQAPAYKGTPTVGSKGHVAYTESASSNLVEDYNWKYPNARGFYLEHTWSAPNYISFGPAPAPTPTGSATPTPSPSPTGTVTYHAFDQGTGAVLRHLWYVAGWLQETLDEGSSTGAYISTVRDGNGNLHVFNQGVADGFQSLRHLWYDGAWHAETLDPVINGVGSTGAYTTAAVSSSGSFNMFNQGAGNTLRHLWWTGSGWGAETLDSGNSTGAYAAVVVDPNGTFHVFNQGSGNSLRHLYWTGTTWAADTLDAGSSTGAYIAAVNSNGLNIFDQGTGSVLRHLWWTGATWGTETLDPVQNGVGSTGAYTSAANASSGGLNLFNQGSGNVLRHLWWTGAGWAAETLDPSGSIGAFTSAGLATTGGYQVFNEGAALPGGLLSSLRHLWWTGSGWSAETLDPVQSTGAYSAGSK